MLIEKHYCGRDVIFKLSGTLTAQSKLFLNQTVLKELDRDPRRIMLDVAKVTDSSALESIEELARECRTRRRDVRMYTCTASGELCPEPWTLVALPYSASSKKGDKRSIVG